MRSVLLPAVLIALPIAACGGGGEAPAPAGPGASTPTADTGDSAPAAASTASGPAKAWDAAAGKVSVTGVAKFSGDAPKRRTVDMGSDPKCEGMHDEGIRDESAIVGAGGELANVFVWVSKGLEGWEFTAPTDPVYVDQKGCAYVPHVLGVQVGQPLEIRNSDPVSHNVHSYAKRNNGFNQTQAPGAAALTKVFKREEVLMSLKCDIHGWMNTYVGVVETPFFAVSGEDGSFDLGKLPAGQYEVSARHEVFGRAKQTITVDESAGPVTVSFTFSEDE